MGFVQELPHELVNAFKATLEEVIEADLILHVRDASDPMMAEQAQVVYETLEQLGVVGDDAPPVIEVMNKKDLVPGLESYLAENIVDSRIAVSAVNGDGVDALFTLLQTWMSRGMQQLDLKLDISDGRTLAYCHEHGTVLSSCENDNILELSVRMSPASAGRLEWDGELQKLRD